MAGINFDDHLFKELALSMLLKLVIRGIYDSRTICPWHSRESSDTLVVKLVGWICNGWVVRLVALLGLPKRFEDSLSCRRVNPPTEHTPQMNSL